jgi:hypothetical protein
VASRFENGWVERPWGFDSLSFRLRTRCGVVESVRRATVNRERQVRALPPQLQPSWSNGNMTPDSQSGGCGFNSRRGRSSGCRQAGIPPVSGTGDRRFDSCRPDCAVEERLPCEPHELETWVRIPPVLPPHLGRSSVAQSTRLSGLWHRLRCHSKAVPALSVQPPASPAVRARPSRHFLVAVV